jgi:hypothetical protein
VLLDNEMIKLLATRVATTNTRCFDREGIAVSSMDDARPPSTIR